MCGLCLPHCPTYLQTRNEAESPRGRIALMNALWQNKLEMEPHLEQHLENCLTCRACEAACPSGVKYGSLIDQTKQKLREQHPPKGLVKLVLNNIQPSRSRLRASSLLVWLYQVLGIRKLAQLFGIFSANSRLKRLDHYLPKPQRPAVWRSYYSTQGAHKKDVSLFTGCATENIDPNTLRATIKVLTHAGFGVHIPSSQNCCGAIHQHTGDHDTALTLMKKNTNAFNTPEVISVATGCASMLAEYPKHLDNPPGWQTIDILDFLLRENALEDIQFAALKKRIAVHTPCSMTNVLKLKQTSYQALSHIPEIELSPLNSNNICCGAAGSYMLNKPDMADALLNNKLNDINEIQPDMVVTSNIGCAIHFMAGLKNKDPNIPVLHPITLLAQCLP